MKTLIFPKSQGVFSSVGYDYYICTDPPDCSRDVVNAGEGDGEVSKLAEVPAAKRRGVKRPQPKLDSNRYERLRGIYVRINVL